MRRRVAIVGGGVLGRTLALELSQHDFEIHIWDKDSSGRSSAAYHAGGMLAPFSEREQGDDLLFQLGLASIELWPSLAQDLGDEFEFHQQGSLIISHERDQPLWQEITEKIVEQLDVDKFHFGNATVWEPDLAKKFSKTLFVPQECHLNPRSFFKSSTEVLSERGIVWHEEDLNNIPNSLQKKLSFDHIIDCRGIGSQESEKDLRGVRGEAIIVEAPEVSLSRPIRVMHPRYSLYIVPRGSNLYYLGATQLESECRDPITVRSALELLSAAFSSHTGFAEGRIVELCQGLRPSYFNHHPEIRVRGTHISVNGLYRHGFLLSPIVSKITASYLLREPKHFGFDLIRKIS